ncbi:unnamed protein product [Pseudo-nitzschia multistriata]|uniref:Uncharacterized protein n=1 Tax=Pseudo-nitzschia multistriata TaxID=183589 RepID=A0A448YZF3_9STRA|nr:unnamed protein product [Pseudo-nitzschia multistriata]
MAKTKTKAATKGGSKREKPPALDQYKMPLIALCLSMLGYHMFRGMMAKEIKRVDMTATANELELREVFFGEDVNTGSTNYAVLCYPENAVFPVSSVFQDAANDGSAPCQFRLMDCDAAMPFSEEGKSVVKRFGLNKKTRPVVFVSGAVGQPKQVPAKYLKTGAMLTKALKNLLEPRAEKIETTQDLRSKCLDKDICGLMLKGGKVSPTYAKEAMQKLVVEYPKVTFAAVDSSVLYVKGIEAEFLPELTPGLPRFIVFQKTSGGVKSDSSRLKSTAIPLDVDVAYGPMSNLVASVVSGKAEMTKIPASPTIKTRTKKLEKSENEKRQRRKNKTNGSGDSSSDSGTPHSGANDGSREGRRAERERRRAEHRKNNPNYREKTPEEIKEMERKRRIRMEEEAKKWNMDAEDPSEDSSSGEYMVEDEGFDEDEENLDEEDEDVMDLD